MAQSNIEIRGAPFAINGLSKPQGVKSSLNITAKPNCKYKIFYIKVSQLCFCYFFFKEAHLIP